MENLPMKQLLLKSIMLLFICSSASFAQVVTIDGQKDAFYQTLTCPDNGHIVIYPDSAFNVSATGAPADSNDLSAKVWMAWDDTYLYYYEERLDDELQVSSNDTWQNDCVELKIDPDPIDPAGDQVLNVRLTVFGADLAGNPTGVDNLNGEGALTNFTPVEGEDYVREYVFDPSDPIFPIGVNMEFRVPWASMISNNGVDVVNVAVGGKIGFGVNITENDGVERDATLQWSAGWQDAIFNTPRLLGTLELLADNKVNFIPQSTRACVIDKTVLVNTFANDWYKPSRFSSGTACPDFVFPATDACGVVILVDPPAGSFTNFEDNIDASTRRAHYQAICGNPAEGHIFIGPDAFLNSAVPPDSEEDLSVNVWMAWDETYLYYYEERKDDILNVNSGDTWQNDKVELKIDPDPVDPAGGQVIPVGLTVLDTADAVVVGSVDNINLDGALDRFKNRTSDYSRHFTADGVNMEMRIPWETIKANGKQDSVEVGVGNVFGLAINITENDGTQRDMTLQWSAGFNDDVFQNTGNFGTIEFLPDNKLKFIATNTRDSLVVNANADLWYTPDPANCVTGIEIEQTANVADAYVLDQNYPNPFNPETTIRYSLKRSDEVTLSVYNNVGQLVSRLITKANQPAGAYEVTWDGKDDNGQQVASGVYLYRISTASFTDTKKMVLMK